MNTFDRLDGEGIDDFSRGVELAWLGQNLHAIRDEPASRLHMLPPGRWRSRGRYLDYTNWPDRNRFAALDNAIEAAARD